MGESESKFSPGYEFMDDPEIKGLQLALDEYVSTGDSQAMAEARKSFPAKLDLAVKSCSGSAERAKLLMNFLQVNTRMNYAGGIGKDINNPVVGSIAKAISFLVKKFPDIFRNLQ